MFSRLFTLLPIAALVAVAAAQDTCSTSDQHCCDQHFEAPTNFFGSGNGLVSAIVHVVAGVPINCSPVTVIGEGIGSSCVGQAACCMNDNVSGGVNFVCNPMSVIA